MFSYKTDKVAIDRRYNGIKKKVSYNSLNFRNSYQALLHTFLYALP
jgi:hypothetical protein